MGGGDEVEVKSLSCLSSVARLPEWLKRRFLRDVVGGYLLPSLGCDEFGEDRDDSELTMSAVVDGREEGESDFGTSLLGSLKS